MSRRRGLWGDQGSEKWDRGGREKVSGKVRSAAWARWREKTLRAALELGKIWVEQRTYEMFPVWLVHAILHCLEDQIRVRRRARERRCEHSQALEVEDLRTRKRLACQNVTR